MLTIETTNTNFIVFALTRPGLKPTIYHTIGEHTNHYATDAVLTDLMYLPLFKIFLKTSSGVSSLKGGIPVKNSKRHTPSAHQSTGIPINKTKISYNRGPSWS